MEKQTISTDKLSFNYYILDDRSLRGFYFEDNNGVHLSIKEMADLYSYGEIMDLNIAIKEKMKTEKIKGIINLCKQINQYLIKKTI